MSGKVGARNGLAALLAAAACHFPASEAMAAPAPAARPSAGRCPAPRAWSPAPRPALARVKNDISFDRNGTAFWNGARIEPARLSQFLRITAYMKPVPETFLEADPEAPCDAVARIAGLIDAALDCTRLCHYRMVRWPATRTPNPPPPPPPPPRR